MRLFSADIVVTQKHLTQEADRRVFQMCFVALYSLSWPALNVGHGSPTDRAGAPAGDVIVADNACGNDWFQRLRR